MRKITVFIFLIFVSESLFSQGLSKDCFDAAGKAVDESASEYCVVGKKVMRIDDHGLGVKDTVESYIDTVNAYYTGADPKLKFLKIYSDAGFEEGNFVEFYPSGRLKERGSYKQGNKVGYITRFYQNGKTWSTLQFLSVDERISEIDEINYKIMTYYDTAGTQLIKSGNGFCRCQLLSGRTEVGKVVDGVRDSIWSEYSMDTLVLQEHYAMGEFIEGVRYYKGKAFKYRKVAESPEYSDGLNGMMDLIRKNMRYPDNARRMGIDGTVIVDFKVNENGTIEDVKIFKGIRKDCDAEAVRVVKLMKKWHPARVRGKPVTVRFPLPIRFKLG
jgi:TonB family protein